MPNKLQVSFRKRATNFRALLQKTISKGKASYDSTPPCIHVYIYMNMCDPSDLYVTRLMYFIRDMTHVLDSWYYLCIRYMTWLIRFIRDMTHPIHLWHYSSFACVTSQVNWMSHVSRVAYALYQSCHVWNVRVMSYTCDMTHLLRTWHDSYISYVTWLIQRIWGGLD